MEKIFYVVCDAKEFETEIHECGTHKFTSESSNKTEKTFFKTELEAYEAFLKIVKKHKRQYEKFLKKKNKEEEEWYWCPDKEEYKASLTKYDDNTNSRIVLCIAVNGEYEKKEQ